ncbi:MAG: hemerythrin family protein [Sulfurospirillum sp.]|nr:hemerythrin family protein [Sulfurospirillum sp.]
MQDLNWKENYAVGEKRIDYEHKQLFIIAQKAFSVVGSDQKMQKIKTIVHELMDYTKIHFYHEEEFMQKASFPKLEEHKKLHLAIIKSMNQFLKTINAKTLYEIEKDLAHFIEIWFIHHIIYEDKKVHIWLKSANLSYKNATWKSEYTIGEATIDAQHQELFEIANEAFAVVQAEDKKEKIKEIIHKLFTYTQEHFAYEEQFMKTINYNNLDEQKSAHQHILNTLNTLVLHCQEANMQALEEKLIEFVDVGLVQHIVQEDKKIGKWLVFLEDLKEAKKLKEV